MSIIGYALVVVIYAIEAALLFLIGRSLRKSNKRWFILAPLIVICIALPIADEIWISSNFNKLCQGAGVQVYEKVEVEGYLDSTSQAGAYLVIEKIVSDPKAIKRFIEDGYSFKEKTLDDGTVRHLELVEEGLEISIINKPRARYVFKYSHNNEQIGYKIRKTEYVIIDAKTDEVIGKDTRYKRYPGFVDWLWIRFFDAGSRICEGTAPQPPELRHLLYHYVLIPIK